MAIPYKKFLFGGFLGVFWNPPDFGCFRLGIRGGSWGIPGEGDSRPVLPLPAPPQGQGDSRGRVQAGEAARGIAGDGFRMAWGHEKGRGRIQPRPAPPWDGLAPTCLSSILPTASFFRGPGIFWQNQYGTGGFRGTVSAPYAIPYRFELHLSTSVL